MRHDDHRLFLSKETNYYNTFDMQRKMHAGDILYFKKEIRDYDICVLAKEMYGDDIFAWLSCNCL